MADIQNSGTAAPVTSAVHHGSKNSTDAGKLRQKAGGGGMHKVIQGDGNEAVCQHSKT